MKDCGRFERVSAALEDLINREAVVIRSGSASAILEVQKRISPIIEELTASARRSTEPYMRERLAALGARRSENTRALAELRDRLAEQVAGKTRSLENLRRITPAYASGYAGPSRLCASS